MGKDDIKCKIFNEYKIKYMCLNHSFNIILYAKLQHRNEKINAKNYKIEGDWKVEWFESP